MRKAKELIEGFNSRKEDAFSEVYSMLYTDLCYYANRIFQDTEIEGCDVVHDIFIALWSNSEIEFKEIVNIKAYAYTSIKNRFKNYVTKNSHIKKYQEDIIAYEDLRVARIVESETLSIINSAISILPKDCAQIFKMYMEGWSIKEIAEKLEISRSGAFEKNKTAFEILKSKNNQFNILL